MKLVTVTNHRADIVDEDIKVIDVHPSRAEAKRKDLENAELEITP